MSDLPIQNDTTSDTPIGQGAAEPVEEAQLGEQHQLVVDPPATQEAIVIDEHEGGAAQEEEAQEGDKHADAAAATSEDEVEDGLEGEADIEDDPTHDQLSSGDLNGAPQISVSLEAEGQSSDKPNSDAGADIAPTGGDLHDDGAEDSAMEDGQSPANPTATLRSVTPGSRTSTPPLSSSAPAAKKFSSVNINKKFLSKTVSPAPGPGSAGAKLSSLGGSSFAPQTLHRTLTWQVVQQHHLFPSPQPPRNSSHPNSPPCPPPNLDLPLCHLPEDLPPAAHRGRSPHYRCQTQSRGRELCISRRRRRDELCPTWDP